MDITEAKTRIDKKQYAQEALMHGIANVLGYWQENITAAELNALGEDGIQEIDELMRQQADRVAKLLGYEKAWVN